MAGFRRFLADQRAAGAAMRLIAEDGVGGGPDRLAAYLRFDAMANEVYRPYRYPWTCLYDPRMYPPDTLRRVRQAPPRLLHPGGRTTPTHDSPPPRDYLARPDPPPLPPATAPLDLTVTGPGELTPLRRRLRRWA